MFSFCLRLRAQTARAPFYSPTNSRPSPEHGAHTLRQQDALRAGVRQGTTACVSFWRAVYHPYIRRVITPTLAMCPLFRKGDRQPYFNHPVKTNHRLQAEAHYKLITSCWPCNTTASLSKACYKGHYKAITRCALRYEPITKLVNHYEYLCRNEARYEARNAAVHSAWERAPARFVCVHTSQRYLATPNTCDVRG